MCIIFETVLNEVLQTSNSLDAAGVFCANVADIMDVHRRMLKDF